MRARTPWPRAMACVHHQAELCVHHCPLDAVASLPRWSRGRALVPARLVLGAGLVYLSVMGKERSSLQCLQEPSHVRAARGRRKAVAGV